MTKSAARAELSRAAVTPSDSHDIFLSHSIKDETIVLGLRNALTSTGLTVYVDWLEDSALDRATVSPTTAVTPQQRMRSCRHGLRDIKQRRSICHDSAETGLTEIA